MSLRRPSKRFIIITSVLLIIIIAFVAWTQKATAPTIESENNNTQPSKPSANQKKESSVGSQQAFDKKNYSIDDPASPWVIVNKKRPLPSSYAPASLSSVGSVQVSSQAATQLNNLIVAGKNAGLGLYTISGFRSYSNQAATYNGWVARDGQAKADTYSARPGHSEHQTGLAIDMGGGSCDLEICFGNTPAGKWLAANSYKYGFTIRYQEGKQSLTGYQYEPWHIRYVGTELASQLQQNGQTMEQFFDLPPVPNY